MHITVSATELQPVQLSVTPSGADVWLRKNIEHDEEENQWTADEVCGRVAHGISVEEIEADFDYYWELFERDAMSEREILERIEAQVWFTALMTDTEIDDDQDGE